MANIYPRVIAQFWLSTKKAGICLFVIELFQRLAELSTLSTQLLFPRGERSPRNGVKRPRWGIELFSPHRGRGDHLEFRKLGVTNILVDSPYLLVIMCRGAGLPGVRELARKGHSVPARARDWWCGMYVLKCAGCGSAEITLTKVKPCAEEGEGYATECTGCKRVGMLVFYGENVKAVSK